MVTNIKYCFSPPLSQSFIYQLFISSKLDPTKYAGTHKKKVPPDLEDQLSYPNFPLDHPLLTDSLLKFADSLLTLGNPLLTLADSQADCLSVSVLNRNSGSLTLMNHFLLVPATESKKLLLDCKGWCGKITFHISLAGGNDLGASWEVVF